MTVDAMPLSPGELTLHTIVLANGVEVELAHRDGWLHGIRAVRGQGVIWRSTTECIAPEIATPDGMVMIGCRIAEMCETPAGVVVRTRPYFRVGHRMEWTEHALHARINTGSWSGAPISPDGAVLEWLITPIEATYDGVTYTGFSYQFHYRVPGQAIYQIEDKASWELGGQAAGNTFIMRNSFTAPMVSLEAETAYTSAWVVPGIANPYIFQHLPLYAQLQGFTFQHTATHILLTVHDYPSHVRSLFQHDPDSPLLLHFNQFCFDLTEEITTPARRILIAACPADGTALINHFLRLRAQIHRDIRAYYDIVLDLPRPSAFVCAQGVASLEKFPPIFAQLGAWGVRQVYLAPIWRSTATEIAPRFAGETPDYLVPNNICCPLELTMPDANGGWEALTTAMAAALTQDIAAYLWFGAHFSPLSPLPRRMPDLPARDVSGQWQRNNYNFDLFAVNEQSEAFRTYLFDAYRKAKACGIRGIFRDSHFNMAADTLNYLCQPYEAGHGGATGDQVGSLDYTHQLYPTMIRSQHDAEVGIQRYFQREMGMLYFVESAGVLGTAGCGTHYAWTRGLEWLFADMSTGFNLDAVRESGDTVEQAYFRGLSTRLMYHIEVMVDAYPDASAISGFWNPAVLAPMNHGFLRVEPHLQTMWVLPDDRGIRWVDGDIDVIFAYTDFPYTLTGPCHVMETISGEGWDAEGTITLDAQRIYLLEPQ